MKKTIYIFSIIAALCVTAASCDKISEMETKFLTVEKIGKSTTASFFAELSGLTAAGEGLHRKMEAFFDSYYLKYGDLMGDMLNIQSITADEGEVLAYDYALRPEHIATYPRNIWTSGWEIITAANTILYYAPLLKDSYPLPADRAKIEKITAWGYFARAVGHWCLCNCYAQPYCFTPDASHLGIPVVDRVPGFDDQIPRQKVKDVYTLVLNDLAKAYDILGSEPSVPDKYHISGIACEALMARIYLYMQKWDDAAKYSEMVIGKVPLTKREDYVMMFREPFTVPGDETILRWNQYDCSSTMVSSYDPTRAGQDFTICPDIRTYFDADDVRKELLTYVGEDCEEPAFRGKVYDAVCKYCPYKHITETERTPNPFFLRVSEMYLIHAEAVANGSAHDLAAAADDIRALEARARGIEKSAVSLSCTDLQSTNDAIMRERIKELCYEGHSLFDYIRRGQGIHRPATSTAKVKDIAYGDYRLILPIDQMEMQANDYMVQNDGYKKE